MTIKTQRQGQCIDCGAPFPFEEAKRYVTCASCRVKRSAAWKEEHTRQPEDTTRKGWLIGDTCTIRIKGITYEGKILDMSDISRRESDYDLVKLELSKTVDVFGKPMKQTWIHPEPIQTYKLRKPYLK